MKRISQRNKSKKGSVLILALIMASILLSVGMGISGIAMKEIKLSSIGTESGKAFYMADMGAECALYWDLKGLAITDMLNDGIADNDGQVVFATSTDPWTPFNPGPIKIKCFNGVDIAASWDGTTNPTRTPMSAITTFTLSDADLTKPCAQIMVTKTNVGSGIITTDIDSRGQSSCDSNPRRVERGLKVSY